MNLILSEKIAREGIKNTGRRDPGHTYPNVSTPCRGLEISISRDDDGKVILKQVLDVSMRYINEEKGEQEIYKLPKLDVTHIFVKQDDHWKVDSSQCNPRI